jgi:hypothetical protein
MAARCPICTTEMDDVDAVRRHTLIVHGKTTADSDGGTWSSVPGPEGEPGWQPDPWNHTALRWWDGSQWSGRTAPLASPEVAEEIAGAAAAAAGGRRTLPVPVIAAVSIGVVVVLIVTVVALTSGHGGHHPAAGSDGAASAVAAGSLPPSSGLPTAPTVSLAQGVLTAGDVGGGWTAVHPAAALTQPEYTQGPCNSPMWKGDVAGYASHLVDGGGGTVRTGEVDSEVLEAGSADEANQQAAFVTSESFVPCVTALVGAGVTATFKGTRLELTQLSADPLPLDVTMAGVGYVFDIGVTDSSSGLGAYVTDDHIELFVNRYEGSLDIISTSLNPIGADLVQQEASLLASRLAALPAAGTTTGGAV